MTVKNHGVIPIPLDRKRNPPKICTVADEGTTVRISGRCLTTFDMTGKNQGVIPIPNVREGLLDSTKLNPAFSGFFYLPNQRLDITEVFYVVLTQLTQREEGGNKKATIAVAVVFGPGVYLPIRVFPVFQK